MRIVNEQLLDYFRGPGLCDWCRKMVSRREPHHIFCRGAGGGSRLDIVINIAGLCPVFSGGDNCHSEYHQGHILRDDLLAVVAARESTTQDEIRRIVYALRAMDKWGDPASVPGFLELDGVA